jgi:predicted ATP-grasp superfamily ATP-dependent carboligase
MRSRHVDGALAVPNRAHAADHWAAWLERRCDGSVLLACSDTGLEFLARRRATLEGLGYCVMEADDDITMAMLDKATTHELATRVGIDVPRTFVVDSYEDAEAAVSEIGLPCALKPRDSVRFDDRFGVKAIVVTSIDDLRATYDRVEGTDLSVVITEIVRGTDGVYSSYYSYLDADGVPLLHFTKCKLRQFPLGFGIGTYHVSRWDPEVADIGLRFFKGIGLRGIGNVEFKRDRNDGKWKLIECNPRFTLADGLVRRAGVDMANLAYRRALGLACDPITTFRDGVRQWHPNLDLHAFVNGRRAGEITTLEWLRSLAHIQHLPVFDWRDPAPSLVTGRRAVRQSVSEAVGRVRARAA